MKLPQVPRQSPPCSLTSCGALAHMSCWERVQIHLYSKSTIPRKHLSSQNMEPSYFLLCCCSVEADNVKIRNCTERNVDLVWQSEITFLEHIFIFQRNWMQPFVNPAHWEADLSSQSKYFIHKGFNPSNPVAAMSKCASQNLEQAWLEMLFKMERNQFYD